ISAWPWVFRIGTGNCLAAVRRTARNVTAARFCEPPLNKGDCAMLRTRNAVVRFLLCLPGAAVCAMMAMPAYALDWPQWLGPNRDGVWRETGLLTRFPAGGPKVLWRTPIGTGYSGPAVAA